MRWKLRESAVAPAASTKKRHERTHRPRARPPPDARVKAGGAAKASVTHERDTVRAATSRESFAARFTSSEELVRPRHAIVCALAQCPRPCRALAAARPPLRQTLRAPPAKQQPPVSAPAVGGKALFRAAAGAQDGLSASLVLSPAFLWGLMDDSSLGAKKSLRRAKNANLGVAWC